MPGHLILATTYLEVSGPLIFLAGPITGAPHWQSTAITLIQTAAPEIHIASPRQPLESGHDFPPDKYDEQVDWETHYLRRAASNGAILFWLAKEAVPHPERAYAQTTRFELGEWKELSARSGANLIIGIEEGFPGARYIKRRIGQDLPKVPLCSTLEETCTLAIERAYWPPFLNLGFSY